MGMRLTAACASAAASAGRWCGERQDSAESGQTPEGSEGAHGGRGKLPDDSEMQAPLSPQGDTPTTFIAGRANTSSDSKWLLDDSNIDSNPSPPVSTLNHSDLTDRHDPSAYLSDAVSGRCRPVA